MLLPPWEPLIERFMVNTAKESESMEQPPESRPVVPVELRLFLETPEK